MNRPANDEANFRHEILRLLAAGSLRAVRTRIGEPPAVPADADALFRALAFADARVRSSDMDMAELQRLRSHVEPLAVEEPTMAMWIDTMMAERLFQELDVMGVLLAVPLAHQATTEPLPPLLDLYLRARVRRLAASAWILSPSPTQLAEGQRWRDLALQDLYRCGFHQEAVLTRAMGAALLCLFQGEEYRAHLETLDEARRLIGEVDESVWPAWLDGMICLVAFAAGDLAAAHAAADRIERHENVPETVRATPELVRRAAALIAERGSPVALRALELSLDTATSAQPNGRVSWHVLLAHLLADFGRTDAIRVGRVVFDLPLMSESQERENEVLRARLDLLAGRPVAPKSVLEALEGVADAGRPRLAGTHALRVAHDLVRAGVEGADRTDTEDLWHWGLTLLPDSSRRTVWEHIWARPLPPPGSARSSLAIRLLVPSLELAVDGRTERMGRNGAKLLALLALEHPRPVGIEQLCDALWPGAALADVRPRLSTLLHRVRQQAGGLDGVVVRHGDVVWLDDERVEVDWVRFHEQLTGSDDERLAALAGVRGNYCDAQFPYDEPFITARHELIARWSREAAALVRRRPATLAELRPAMAALGIDATVISP